MPYIRVRPEGLQRMSEMLDRVEKDIEQRDHWSIQRSVSPDKMLLQQAANNYRLP